MSSIGGVGVVYKGNKLVVMVTTYNIVTIVNTCGEEILENNIVIVLQGKSMYSFSNHDNNTNTINNTCFTYE